MIIKADLITRLQCCEEELKEVRECKFCCNKTIISLDFCCSSVSIIREKALSGMMAARERDRPEKRRSVMSEVEQVQTLAEAKKKSESNQGTEVIKTFSTKMKKTKG